MSHHGASWRLHPAGGTRCPLSGGWLDILPDAGVPDATLSVMSGGASRPPQLPGSPPALARGCRCGPDWGRIPRIFRHQLEPIHTAREAPRIELPHIADRLTSRSRSPTEVGTAATRAWWPVLRPPLPRVLLRTGPGRLSVGLVPQLRPTRRTWSPSSIAGSHQVLQGQTSAVNVTACCEHPWRERSMHFPIEPRQKRVG